MKRCLIKKEYLGPGQFKRTRDGWVLYNSTIKKLGVDSTELETHSWANWLRIQEENMKYYNKEGEEITKEEREVLLEDEDYTTIAFTKTKGGQLVTYWRGIGGIRFESWILSSPKEESWDGSCWRTKTLKEAKAKHEELVKKYL